jgi:GTPase SAR1 family protein
LINENKLRELLKEDESPILEFKREWYWDDSTLSDEMPDKWGEFLKDLISLSNGYLGFVGNTRYLIFGFSETTQEIHDVNLNSIRKLSNLKLFKKQLIEKLERYTFPSFLNFKIDILQLDGKDLLVFEIPSPLHLTELKKDLKTKTRVLDTGSVLIRKGQNSDEIRTASPKEIADLTAEFEIYKSSQPKIANYKESVGNTPERSIEKTVQLYIDKNSSYSLAVGYPQKVSNWKDGVIFEVYKLADEFGSFREFVYLHSSCNQGKTLGYIKQNKLVDKLDCSIILTDRPDIKDVEKRKENIKSNFATKFVYFVDEFGYEFLYKDCILDYQKYNLPIYVDSRYDQDDDEDLSAFNKLKEWFISENEPLFIIKGHGGIGKTTLAKQFLDKVYDESNDAGILFIDSKEIIDELSRNTGPKNKIEDVYDFYKAQMAIGEEDVSRFSKDLLKLSMDNGSLIIVLDGIDEVIAKLGDRFDVESFITSIGNEYSSDLNRTKVLITCRDHFWNDVGKKIQLPEITLKAFSESLAYEFFSQSLDADSKKIQKAMDIATSLAIEEQKGENQSSGPVFIPFLLDIIAYLIKTKNEDFSSYNSFESTILSKENHIDFLIAKVCDREVIKLGSLDLDKQIQLFMKIATKKENGISLYDIKPELSSLIDSDVEEQLIEKLKGHPLLICSGNSISFRYDVFNVYFKSLFLVNFFRKMNASAFDEKTANIIRGYMKYDSSFTDFLCERIDFNDDLVIFCMEIIEAVREADNIEQESVISSLLALLLCLLQTSKIHQSNIESRTELIEKLFGDASNITGLCLVDIFGEGNVKPTFDFRGKHFLKCTFDNYEYFWECSINQDTRFEKSFFRAIEPREGIKIKIWEHLFSNDCNTSSIQHLINQKEDENQASTKAVIDNLVKFFRLFYERGNFYPRKQEHVRSKLFAAKLLPILLDKKVVKEFHDPKKPTMKQFKISEEYKSIINYIEQGSQCAELFRLADELVS